MLINPPNTIFKVSNKRVGEPMGLLYLGTMLKKQGYGVTILDMALEGYHNCVIQGGSVTYGISSDELKKRIRKYTPDLIGVGCPFSGVEENTKNVCRTVKSVIPGMPVVVGGLHPSLFPGSFINPGYADYVILGEGERRLIKLIDCLNKGNKINFDGVAYSHNGSLVVKPMVQRIKNLDAIPYPDRSLIDMEKYHKVDVRPPPFSYERRVAKILATRGCPVHCNFCATANYWGHQLRVRSVDNVIGEVKELVEKYNIKEIQFIDDNLTFDKKFAKELFRKLKEFNIRFCVSHGLYINSLDTELIRLMAESGAYQLVFAVESASKRVLRDIIHKNVNLDRVKKIVDEAHKYDISIYGMFVLGFPGERKEEIMQSLEFPYKAGFDSVIFHIVFPMPGTALYKECIDKGYLINKSFFPFPPRVNIKIPKDSPDYHMDYYELERLIDKATEKFNKWAKKKYPGRLRRSRRASTKLSHGRHPF